MSRSGGPYKIGQRFGPYRLEEYLGGGAFKSVYKATRQGAAAGQDLFALGFPHQQDAEGLAELEKELAACSRLVHPNILRVYGIERHEEVSFLVMEYLEGESLRGRLRRQTRLSAQEALRYTGLVAEALSYAHSLRVLHRDVKPENIFLTTEGAPKLLDFGIARVLAHTASIAGTRIGTIQYMAPEQFQGAAGTNADLWSLGVSFHEMLTGCRPFVGETAEVMHHIMNSPLDEGALREAGVDGRIVRVLRKMLDKDPERRYRTAEELADDLELAARRTRLVEDDEGRLEVIIRASFPLVYVVSFEERRVLEAVRRIADRLGADRKRAAAAVRLERLPRPAGRAGQARRRRHAGRPVRGPDARHRQPRRRHLRLPRHPPALLAGDGPPGP
jgi:serine/threonine protein kinase